MPRIVHFQIGVDDPARAIAFYRDVFQWEIEETDPDQEYWPVRTGSEEEPGINGGLFKRQGPVGVIPAIQVPAIDEYAARVQAHGGQVVVGKQTIPGMGYLAYCQDTEGNLLGIFQESSTA